MARWRQAVELAMNDGDVARLLTISRSRTEPASWVERAQMLLAYREKPSFFAVGQRLGVHHQTVQRCIERALAYGPVSYTHLRAHETRHDRVCRLLLGQEKDTGFRIGGGGAA